MLFTLTTIMYMKQARPAWHGAGMHAREHAHELNHMHERDVYVWLSVPREYH